MKTAITVPTREGAPTAQVDADVFGAWAVHESITSESFPGDPEFPYSITFVPNGMRLPWNYASHHYELACAVARRLSETHPNIGNDPGPEIKREVEGVLSKVHAEHGERWP